VFLQNRLKLVYGVDLLVFYVCKEFVLVTGLKWLLDSIFWLDEGSYHRLQETRFESFKFRLFIFL